MNNDSRKRYDYTFLENFCKENDITLLKDYSNENINIESKIEFKCKYEECNEKCCKKLEKLKLQKNFGCIKHSKIYKSIKSKKTCLEKYGVENPSQNEIVREKSKKTCLKKYGKEYSTQTDIMKYNSKKTCLKRYGVEYASQNEEIKQKIEDTTIQRYGVKHNSQNENIKKSKQINSLIKFGTNTPLQNNNIKQKIKKTNIEKYGVENVSQNEEIKHKKKDTTIINYGVEYPLQNEIVREKSKKTCLEKYGKEHYTQTKEHNERVKKTCLEKYGVEYSLQSQEIKDKGKQTSLKKYGVEYPNQNKEIMEKISKNSYKQKDYILPSNNILKIQGYENYALDELIQNENIDETEIKMGCKNVPEIWYIDENNIKHRHFVDIYIPSKNKCIEVKSTWTAEKKKDNIFLKQQAGKENGYNYEIWVYNGKGEKVECYI